MIYKENGIQLLLISVFYSKVVKDYFIPQYNLLTVDLTSKWCNACCIIQTNLFFVGRSSNKLSCDLFRAN